MAEANSIHTDFLSQTAKDGNDGFEILRRFESRLNDYIDLGYGPLALMVALAGPDSINVTDPITQDDAVGTLQGMPIGDVEVMMEGIMKIGQIMNADNGRIRKAIKRIAAYNR